MRKSSYKKIGTFILAFVLIFTTLFGGLGSLGINGVVDEAYAGTEKFGQTTLYDVPTTTAAIFAGDAINPTDYVVSESSVTIKTDKGMAWLTQNSDYWTSAYVITMENDICVSEFIWSPIGNYTNTFEGTFDGGGKIISGVYIESTTDKVGLFGCNTGIIKNVGLKNSDITGTYYVGAIVGLNKGGTIMNCWNSGKVYASGSSNCGGIAGYSTYEAGSTTYSYIYNCWNSGEIKTKTNNCGGIVGENGANSYISNNYNTGTISGEECIGGIVGRNYNSDVDNSYNTGTISGKTQLGGIAGSSIGGSYGIYNSYNVGSVSSNDSISGAAVGGVLGQLYSGKVSSCYYRAICATDGSGVIQTGIGSESLRSASTDLDGTTNVFSI